MNEKWPENLACCHKRIYLNACAAHDSFPLRLAFRVTKGLPRISSADLQILIKYPFPHELVMSFF